MPPVGATFPQFSCPEGPPPPLPEVTETRCERCLGYGGYTAPCHSPCDGGCVSRAGRPPAVGDRGPELPSRVAVGTFPWAWSRPGGLGDENKQPGPSVLAVSHLTGGFGEGCCQWVQSVASAPPCSAGRLLSMCFCGREPRSFPGLLRGPREGHPVRAWSAASTMDGEAEVVQSVSIT